MALKRKLTQEDLRKAMNEHKKKLSTVKKIESPVAKYTDAGQLMCVLCKTIVKNETVWVVHLNSKTHKENIALAKKTKLETDTEGRASQSTFKRPLSPPRDATETKKIKGILKNAPAHPPNAPSGLPADFFDNTFKHPNAPITRKSDDSKEASSNVENNSKSTEDKKEKDKEKEKGKDTSQTVLPEGFFDDPILDAKVRNVEYKNPIEEEWEKFQKEIKEETAQSAQIIADDQEEATTERQLDEIEEQIRHWSRVMDLVKRKEEVQATDRKQDSIDNDDSSGDEADFDEFLDWRAKTSYQ